VLQKKTLRLLLISNGPVLIEQRVYEDQIRHTASMASVWIVYVTRPPRSRDQRRLLLDVGRLGIEEQSKTTLYRLLLPSSPRVLSVAQNACA